MLNHPRSLELMHRVQRLSRALAPGGPVIALRNSNFHGEVRFDSAGQLEQMDLNTNGVRYTFETGEDEVVYTCRQVLADGWVLQEKVSGPGHEGWLFSAEVLTNERAAVLNKA